MLCCALCTITHPSSLGFNAVRYFWLSTINTGSCPWGLERGISKDYGTWERNRLTSKRKGWKLKVLLTKNISFHCSHHLLYPLVRISYYISTVCFRRLDIIEFQHKKKIFLSSFSDFKRFLTYFDNSAIDWGQE